MVNAAVEIRYGKDFYKEGDKLPDALVKHFEIYDPSVLDSYIELNGIWQKIESAGKGFIEENKLTDRRLKRFFKIKDVKPKEKEPEKMFKVKEEEPKEIPEPKAKYTGITFKALKREQQEAILTKLGISFSKKDKERDLIRKYLKNV